MANKLYILNSLFKYKSDPNKKDVWNILDLGVSGEGDCEDYALTALYYLSDKSLLKFWWELITFQSSIHFVTLGGVGHAVLEYNGIYIENTKKSWMNEIEFKRYVTPVKRFMPWHVARRLLMGKIYRMRNK